VLPVLIDKHGREDLTVHMLWVAVMGLPALHSLLLWLLPAACPLQNIRKKFPLVLGRINQLITRLEALGPQASVDVSAPRLQLPATAMVHWACVCSRDVWGLGVCCPVIADVLRLRLRHGWWLTHILWWLQVDQAALRVTLDVIGLVRHAAGERGGGGGRGRGRRCEPWIAGRPKDSKDSIC
jgi:hypothetical protein